MITQELLKELLSYDPETGIFVWLNRDNVQFNGKSGNKNAGWVTERGYLRIEISDTAYSAHRLAWFYVHGEWPDITDHINGIKLDNRIVNLRSVNSSENSRNRAMTSKNTSGVVGVHWRVKPRKWQARIHINGKRVSLGHFKTIEEASKARDKALKENGYDPRHGKRKPQ